MFFRIIPVRGGQHLAISEKTHAFLVIVKKIPGVFSCNRDAVFTVPSRQSPK